MRFTPAFAAEGLDVYEGRIALVARFAGPLRASVVLRAEVTAQACNEEVCLPPSRLPVTVEAPR